MNFELLDRKDFWAGLSLIATGALAVFIARNYPFGSSLRMGPGYFPIVLGSMLVLLGIVVAGKALHPDADRLPGPWLPRLLLALLMMLIVCGVTLHSHTPFYLAAAVALAGVAYVLYKRRRGEPVEASPSSRALIIVPLALVAFGLLIDRTGFIPAMFVLVLGSATASTQFKLVEQLLFAVFMTALCVVVFIWTLGLPYELIVGFW